MHRLVVANVTSPAHLVRMSKFDFGSSAVHQELNYWLAHEAESEVQMGTSIWAYRDAQRRFVGFSSLRHMDWPFQGTSRTTTAFIPALALRREYWGEPAEAKLRKAWAEMYCNQIMDHLIHTAAPNLRPRMALLTLCVHPENTAAIDLYRRHGFEDTGVIETDDSTQQPYYVFSRRL